MKEGNPPSTGVVCSRLHGLDSKTGDVAERQTVYGKQRELGSVERKVFMQGCDRRVKRSSTSMRWNIVAVERCEMSIQIGAASWGGVLKGRRLPGRPDQAQREKNLRGRLEPIDEGKEEKKRG